MPLLSAVCFGPVAQLIERVVRNDEVVGLIPIRSTNFRSIGAGRKRAVAHAGIPLVDASGRRIDLHALRATFATDLMLSGASR